LASGGRCAIVVPDGILYRAESAFSSVRRRLMTEFNVTAIVRLPPGVFPTAPDTRTNLLFFDRAESKPPVIKYYQVVPPVGKRAYSKTSPLLPEVLDGARKWIRDGLPNEYSWEISIEEIRQGGYDLDIPWRVPDQALDESVRSQRIEELVNSAQMVREIAGQLIELSEHADDFATARVMPLKGFVEERGARAGRVQPEQFVGVSNSGGLGIFKGKPAKDTSRYRRLEVGDFVYNPMRVNVGSIALCSSEGQAGWVSPDYIVFRVSEGAPFTSNYLLTFLKSELGKSEITRRSRGAVRRRLYFENLLQVEVPVPDAPEAWEAMLGGLASLRRHIRELPALTDGALSAIEERLFRA